MSRLIWPEWFALGPRAIGRTTALVEAAKKLGATFVVATPDSERIAHDHGVPTINIHEDPRGTHGPFIFDHLAMLEVVHDYEDRLEQHEEHDRYHAR